MMSPDLEKQFSGFLNTPQIFSGNDIFKYPRFETDAEVSPSLLSKLTEPSTGVLGKRMEHFFSYYIRNFTEEEVLAENQQIIQDNLTLGELDFLLKNKVSKEITHVELVYKFYLYDPKSGESEVDRWIGPNRRDSLKKKLDRLERKQFPLLFNTASKPLLENLSISAEEAVQKVCFKANLFLPHSEENQVPNIINPAAVKGSYIQIENFTADNFGKSFFFSPPKPQWPVSPEHNDTWYAYSEILKQILPFLESKKSPLLWMKTSEGKFKRLFIVWW